MAKEVYNTSLITYSGYIDLTCVDAKLNCLCFYFQSTTIVLPASLDDGSKLVATALGLYKNVIVKNNKMGMPSELSNQASSTGQVEHGVAYDSEDKPVFSLQRTKETL